MSSENFKPKLRSQHWFDNPSNPSMTALYLERSLNFGFTPEELRSGKPIIGIVKYLIQFEQYQYSLLYQHQLVYK